MPCKLRSRKAVWSDIRKVSPFMGAHLRASGSGMGHGHLGSGRRVDPRDGRLRRRNRSRAHAAATRCHRAQGRSHRAEDFFEHILSGNSSYWREHGRCRYGRGARGSDQRPYRDGGSPRQSFREGPFSLEEVAPEEKAAIEAQAAALNLSTSEMVRRAAACATILGRDSPT